MIDLDPDRPGRFRYGLSPDPSPAAALLTPRIARASLAEIPAGEIAEVQPASISIAGTIGTRLAALGGAALIVDYGHGISAPGDTFQAVKAHAHADPAGRTGPCRPDGSRRFRASGRRRDRRRCRGPWPPSIKAAFWAASASVPVPNAWLAAPANGRERAQIATALKRLTAPEEMGRLFKVLALTPPRPVGAPRLRPGARLRRRSLSSAALCPARRPTDDTAAHERPAAA